MIPRRNAIIYYLYKKLVGAGFSFSIFVICIIQISSLNLYELSETLTSPWIWVAFYGYGLLCSLMIDWLGRKWVWAKRWAFLLYIFAGFILFAFVFNHWVIFLIAGTIGAIVALLFYIGTQFITKNKWVSFIFAMILPILFIVVSMTDFTKKENWEVIQDESIFEAKFTYFNGEHKIPIQLAKGEVLSFHVDFQTEDGWGNHLENKKGKYLPMTEQGNKLVFTAEEEGEYYIVVNGDRASGRFVVDWEITQ